MAEDSTWQGRNKKPFGSATREQVPKSVPPDMAEYLETERLRRELAVAYSLEALPKESEQMAGTNRTMTGIPYWVSGNGRTHTADALDDDRLVNIINLLGRSYNFEDKDRWLIREAQKRRLMGRVGDFKNNFPEQVHWLAEVLRDEVVAKPRREVPTGTVALSDLVKQRPPSAKGKYRPPVNPKREIPAGYRWGHGTNNGPAGEDLVDYEFMEYDFDAVELRDAILLMELADIEDLAESVGVDTSAYITQPINTEDGSLYQVVNQIVDRFKFAAEQDTPFYINITVTDPLKEKAMNPPTLEEQLAALDAQRKEITDKINEKKGLFGHPTAVMAVGGAALASKMVAATEAVALVEKLARKIATKFFIPEGHEDILDTPQGTIFIDLSMPLALHLAATHELFGPGSEFVAATGEYAFAGNWFKHGKAMTEKGKEIMAEFAGELDELKEMGKVMMGIGNDTPAIEDSPPDFEELTRELEELREKVGVRPLEAVKNI